MKPVYKKRRKNDLRNTLFVGHDAMRKAIVISCVAIFLYLAFFADRTCLTMGLSQFQSFEEKTIVTRLPNSDTDPGEYYKYHATISFRFGQYVQQESDFFITGSYRCRSGKVTVHSPSGGTFSANYDPSTGILVWGGKHYRRSTSQP